MSSSPSGMSSIARHSDQRVRNGIEDEADHQCQAGKLSGKAEDRGVIEEQQRRQQIVGDAFRGLPRTVCINQSTRERGRPCRLAESRGFVFCSRHRLLFPSHTNSTPHDTTVNRG